MIYIILLHDKKNAINYSHHTNVCMKLGLRVSGSYNCALYLVILGLQEFKQPASAGRSLLDK